LSGGANLSAEALCEGGLEQEKNMLRRISLFFVACITLITLSSPVAYAKYSGGSGTSRSPYKIGTFADLLALAANTGDYGKHFALTADIDLDPNLPSGQVFTAAVIAPDTDNTTIDFDGTTFTGTFDGAGHKITNLTINTGGAGNDYLGLFGYVSGDIKNLGLENVIVTGGNDSNCIGGFVGTNDGIISNCYSTGFVKCGYQSWDTGGLVGGNDGVISNCHSTCTVAGSDYSYSLGGLVGRNNGIIGNCYSTGAVTSGVYPVYFGGLVGNNYGIINNCHSTCDVSCGYQSWNIGGLVGCIWENSSISNCYSTGAVTGGVYSFFLGGLVGDTWYGSISNCYATGDVSSGDYSDNLGGLAGENYYCHISNCYSTGNVGGHDQVGGLVGWNLYGSISNCYSTGNVNGRYSVGGLVGRNSYGVTSSSFWDTQTSGRTNSAGGVGKTTEQMQDINTFLTEGWDFIGETVNGTEDIWTIDEGLIYPKLTWQSISSPGVEFGSFGGQKNVKRTLKDCNDNDVMFSLSGPGYGELDCFDCNFSNITLYDTDEKTVLSIKTRGNVGTSVGDIICNGPLKGINAKTIDLQGSIEIGSSSNPRAAVIILCDQANNLEINSQMPIKSISAIEWVGGSVDACSIGCLTIKGDKKRAIRGDLVDVELVLSQRPDAKKLALSKLAVKGWIDSSRILSEGNIGTVTAGAIIDSSCFAGVEEGVMGLPDPETEINYDEPATIRKITIKGIKGEPSPYYINSNIAAAQILSVYLAYPDYDNGGTVFGIAADYIKVLRIKDADGAHSWKKLDKPTDAPDLPGNAEILLHEP
jgi:hypothetical protein